MTLNINGKEVGLKVSMWVIDDDRLINMLNEKPNSNIWKCVSYFFIAHLNFCRYNKIEPVITTDEIDMFVDEQISNLETREAFKASFEKVVTEITGMLPAEEKKILLSEPAGEV